MKKLNLPLILGSIIIVLLILIMIFPRIFTDINPYGIQQIKAWTEEGGKFQLQAAPFPPSKDAILGTDELGRDILSFIIYGTRLTIGLGLLVVICRFLIALPMGMTAGFGSIVSKAVINQFNIVFNAIPALLVSLIILKLDYFVNLDKQHSILAFVLILSFVGWSKLGLIIMERVQEILSKPFIKGEISIGKNRFKIAIENVIPHLAAEIVVLFFMEIARVLTLIMELGVFGVFVGNLRIVEDMIGEKIIAKNISFEPEWASMLGTARNQIRSAPWNVFAPAFAFFISVLGFNLFGEGLRSYLQQRDSKFIPILRRILSFNFKIPKLIKGQKIKASHKVVVATLVVVIVFSSLYFGNMDKYKFTLDNSTYAFSSNLENQIIIGSQGAEAVALNIASQMQQIGLEPLDDNGFIREYTTKDIYVPINSNFEVEVNNDKRNLVLGKDYSLVSFGDISLNGKVYDATKDDMFNIKDYGRFSNKFVVLDKKFYTDEAIRFFADNILEKSSAKGVLCIARNDEALFNSIGDNISKDIVALISKELGSFLTSNKDVNLNISVSTKKLNNVGRNVLGILHGEDQTVGDEAIIIGLGYNYMDKDIGEKRLQFALELMKRLCEEDSNRNRSIIFAFWDGTIKDEYDGIRDYVEDIIYPIKKSAVYIDLSKLNSCRYDYLNYNSEQAPLSRYFAWSFAHQFEKNCDDKGIEINKYDVKDYYETQYEGSSVDNQMFIKRSIATIIIRTPSGSEEGKFDLEDLGKLLVKTINENNY